ncbi:coiled-coil domain-containing protein 18-like [Patiria miniata]|uniref:Uncharacterized protein n=1 Tax=Patiria miniata TaxID=46514 RepID=A0A914AJQ1_PATMI|nr:coiled-coil domain-containing protein 18-like [Patiria miniata]
MAVKEHQSESEQKILQLENSLSKSQYELKQCSRKIGELDDRCGEHQETLKERALQVQQLEQVVSRQKSEINHKAMEITQLQKRIEDLSHQCSSHHEEELAQGQQLRLTREQMQRHHVELTEARRQLAQVQREKDQLARDYEDAVDLCHGKDEDHARLAEEHGAVMAREAETETRFGAELERIRDLQLREMEVKEQELAQLQDSHAALLASKNQLEASHRLEINRLKEAETRSRQDVESLREKVTGLENELAARKEVIQAANEAIVIKEAEVARLNARISGYERATFGTQFTTHQPPNRPSSTPGRGNIPYLIPPLMSPASPHFQSPRTVLRRSASDHNLPSAGSGDVPGTLHNGLQDTHLHTGSPHHGKHSRHLTDTGYQSRGPYISQDFHEPVTTHRYDPQDAHSRSRFTNEPATLGHFSDTDSVEDAENFETLQGMLAFVNRHIAGHQQQNPATHSDSLNVNNSNFSGLTDHGQSSVTDTTQEDSELALDLSEFQQDDRRQSWESPRKGREGARTSLGDRERGVSPSPKSPDRGRAQGHKPRIMKSPGQSDGSSPKVLPLKKRLAAQRAKLVTNKTTTEAPLKPEDCMADLQDRLRANDERRRRIDDQLYNMRDHARKITNRILGKDESEDR